MMWWGAGVWGTGMWWGTVVWCGGAQGCDGAVHVARVRLGKIDGHVKRADDAVVPCGGQWCVMVGHSDGVVVWS